MAMRPGGQQRIPRPADWQPGGLAPWHDADLSPLRSFGHVVERLSAHAPRAVITEAAQQARPSAVLVTLHPGEDGVEVVLTKRASHLKNHKGEISFPGGRVEPDESVREAALREAVEEVSMPVNDVALVAELDLVISVCTAVIHLAGALGKPVWIMAPFSPEWRYGFQGETMPWYPSSRLFRQPGYGQWRPVIADVAKSLSVWPMRHTDVQNREY